MRYLPLQPQDVLLPRSMALPSDDLFAFVVDSSALCIITTIGISVICDITRLKPSKKNLGRFYRWFALYHVFLMFGALNRCFLWRLPHIRISQPINR